MRLLTHGHAVSLALVVGATMQAMAGTPATDMTTARDNVRVATHRQPTLHQGTEIPFLNRDHSPATTRSRAAVDLNNFQQNTPISFTENRGQIADESGRVSREVLYTATSNGMNLYFTPDGVSFVFNRTEAVGQISEATGRNLSTSNAQGNTASDLRTVRYRVDMDLVGANANPTVRAEQPTSAISNYYYAHCPEGITGVRSYGKLVYENVYENIDMVFTATAKGFEYDFVVRPGGRVSDIRMRYDGATAVASGANGSTRVVTPMGEISESAPKTFVQVGDARQAVASRFQRKGGVTSFVVGRYDRSKTLVIDPMVSWATFLGGNGTEYAQSVSTVDVSGNVFAAGPTSSTNFPGAAGTFQTTYGGGLLDAYCSKFNSGGSLLWSTYYGGSLEDRAVSVTTDYASPANVIFGGLTNTTGTGFPTSAGAHQTSYGGGQYDGFVVKLNTNGARTWGTLYGGAGEDGVQGVAVDASNNVFVTGYTSSTTSIHTAGTFQTALSGGAGFDAFLVKFNSTGARQYGTYYGGTGNDYGRAITVDGNGDPIFTGETLSTNFPVSATPFQAAQATSAGNLAAGNSDAFIVKFNNAGTRQFATYYGGVADDRAAGIDSYGTVIYVGGFMNSNNFPVSGGAFDATPNGLYDAFILKFDGSGNRSWATLYGGFMNDYGRGVGIDPSGNVVLVGNSESTDLPISAGAVQTNNGGLYDAYLIRLNSSGSFLFSSYYGGQDNDGALNVSVDAAWNTVMSGYTASSNFATTAGAAQTVYGGGAFDAFLVSGELSDSPLPVELSGFNATSQGGNVYLDWRTASEIANAGFEVQRSNEVAGSDRTDDSHVSFTTIASYNSDKALEGLGTSAQGKSYSFVDQASNSNLKAGASYYYRIVDISTDGIRTEHNPRLVRVEGNDGGNGPIYTLAVGAVTPNPATNRVTVDFTLASASTVTVEIFDVQGAKIAVPVSARSYSAGEQSETISVEGLAPGAYVLRLTADGRARTQQFVVAR